MEEKAQILQFWIVERKEGRYWHAKQFTDRAKNGIQFI